MQGLRQFFQQTTAALREVGATATTPFEQGAGVAHEGVHVAGG